MTVLTHTTDEKARINLPKNFANSTVLVEQVSDTELRIRKARVIPEDELPFVEEAMAPLSDRDRDVFLALLDSPPPPNDALQRLLRSGHPQEQGDAGDVRSGQSVDLVALPWPEFFARVRAEQHPPAYPLMQERLQVLRAIRQLFAQEVHFRDLDYVARRKVAGLLKSANPDFLLFGSMQWVGLFKRAVKDNNEEISLALDEIPLEGDIARSIPTIHRSVPEGVQALRDGAGQPVARHEAPRYVRLRQQREPGRAGSSIWDQPEQRRARVLGFDREDSGMHLVEGVPAGVGRRTRRVACPGGLPRCPFLHRQVMPTWLNGRLNHCAPPMHAASFPAGRPPLMIFCACG